MRALEIFLIGMGATLCIDLWAFGLRTLFGVRSLDYCMLGRWVLHMPDGRFMHTSIGASAPKAHECKVGWTAHYSIGVGFSALFVRIVSPEWLNAPRLLPALMFGIATVAVPFLTMQPALGLGIAASRAKHPAAARAKSLMTHAIFGLGLYVSATILQIVFR